MHLSIQQALKYVVDSLQRQTDTARLDAELLISYSTQSTRTYLYAHPETLLTPSQTELLQEILMRRLQGEPIAYILGYQEFWSIELEVTPDTLIPRPETEHLVEWCLENLPAQAPLRIADLGTGSGAIAIALASERPAWHIDATDTSLPALLVAQRNAARYELRNIDFYHGDWYHALPDHQYGVIVSNPPYISENDPHLAALQYEPINALRAQQQGLSEIAKIVEQAHDHLISGGMLILEHGFDQASKVASLLKHYGFDPIQTYLDLAGHERFTIGFNPSQ